MPMAFTVAAGTSVKQLLELAVDPEVTTMRLMVLNLPA